MKDSLFELAKGGPFELTKKVSRILGKRGAKERINDRVRGSELSVIEVDLDYVGSFERMRELQKIIAQELGIDEKRVKIIP